MASDSRKSYKLLQAENDELRQRLAAYEEMLTTVDIHPTGESDTQSRHTAEPSEVPLWVSSLRAKRSRKAPRKKRYQTRVPDKYLRTIFDSAPIGISVATDSSCRVIRHNSAAAKFLRIELCKSPSFLVPDKPKFKILYQGKELLPEELPIQRAAWYGEETKGIELEFIWEDGVNKHVLVNANPLYSDDGEIVGSIATFEDITERKRAEEVHRRSEDVLRALLHSMDDAFGIWEVIFEGERPVNLRHVLSNQAAVRMAGMGEFDGKTILDINPDLEPYWIELWGRVAKTGVAEHYELPAAPPGRVYSGHIFKMGAADENLVAGITQDITERKRAEEALRESEERFRALVTASSELMYKMSPDWSVMYQLQSRGFLANTERPNDNWLRDYIPPEDQPYVTAAIDEAIRKKRVFELEHRVWQADGSRGWTFSRAVPLVDEKGEIVEWFGAASDITERKRIEEALRESEERQSYLLKLSDLLRSIQDPLEIQNVACTLINDQLGTEQSNYTECYEDKGYFIIQHEKSEETGFNFKGKYFKEDYPVGLSIVRSGSTLVLEDTLNTDVIPEAEAALLFAQRTRAQITVPLIKDGRLVAHFSVRQTSPRRWTQLEISLVEETAERTWAAVERARAEEALRKSEKRFQTILRNSPDIITIFNMKDGKLVDANQRFLDTIEYTREEVLGRTTEELNLRVDDEDYIQPIFNQLINQGRVENVEFRLRTRSGRVITVLSSVDIIDLYGEKCRVSIVKDITAIRRMELEISRLDRLNLVGEMAASIGHEIRNPMTTIRGFLQMVSEKDGCQSYREYFDLMLEELDRANSIISDYLSMAKDKAIDLKPGYLNSIIKAILPMIQADANLSEKQVKLDLDSPPTLLIDEKEIRQLIINLARNGMEAMQPRGTLTIRTRTDNGEAVLEIEDQGFGIPPEILERIGTPFQTTKENGTGLGLPVCYSIAARHNAKIEVETGPGGTTFRVRFKSNGNKVT